MRLDVRTEWMRTPKLAAMCAVVMALLVTLAEGVDAHGVSGKDAVFLQGLQGRAIGPLMYLGAKHMVTGYDHLLFLVGVIFFFTSLRTSFNTSACSPSVTA